jgi:glyoxylase I family protein
MAGINKPWANGFHHTAVKAANFDAVVKFYIEALGFRMGMSWGQGNERAAMLDAGDGCCLEVFAGGSSAPKPEGSVIRFALRTDDCDAALERARAAGAEVLVTPRNHPLVTHERGTVPTRMAFCRGLAGEIIEFLECPAKSGR